MSPSSAHPSRTCNPTVRAAANLTGSTFGSGSLLSFSSPSTGRSKTFGTFRYFLPPSEKETHSNSERDLSEVDSSDGTGKHGSARGQTSGRSGACTHCKSLKVKCNFILGEQECQRCKLGNHECAIYLRKKRRPVPTHEELLERTVIQDKEISRIIQQIDSIAEKRRIADWVAKAQPNTSSSSLDGSASHFSTIFGDDGDDGHERHRTDERSNLRTLPNPGDPNFSTDFYQLVTHFPDLSIVGIDIRHLAAPLIATSGLLSPREIYDLFNIYFKNIHPLFPVLDPDLHTPAKTLWNNHFLFTVICAISSRYYHVRHQLHKATLEFAQDAAEKALVGGAKTVDTCQAYILMAVYPLPVKKWSRHSSWLFSGMASTVANQLLSAGPYMSQTAQQENITINHARMWLNCFYVDGSHATLFGKAPNPVLDDYFTRNCREWYRSSIFNLPEDVYLVANVEMVRVMNRFLCESPMPQDDYRITIKQYFDELCVLRNEWSRRFSEHPPTAVHRCRYLGNAFHMTNAYYRLVVLSASGLQNVIREGSEGVASQCIPAAEEVVLIMTKKLYATGMLRYDIDIHFFFATYAASFLLNLLTTDLSTLVDGKFGVIRSLLQEFVGVLGSEAMSSYNRATPRCNARFLLALMKPNTGATPMIKPPLKQDIPLVGQGTSEGGQNSTPTLIRGHHGVRPHAPQTEHVDLNIEMGSSLGITRVLWSQTEMFDLHGAISL
ncbi:hypothetical protein BD410DRAFT_610536 [Rickenella mellea]|uniref:Zn(2)-C6 fungal-type domain-containing protein n=1 Tax=Rickenella mellea TaxID=50990 RepID=A0A4Y7QDV1_9AGAM|nr:hypothetical protein BD410DRAFT_610536 [Rickenella mellea]